KKQLSSAGGRDDFCRRHWRIFCPPYWLAAKRNPILCAPSPPSLKKPAAWSSFLETCKQSGTWGSNFAITRSTGAILLSSGAKQGRKELNPCWLTTVEMAAAAARLHQV